MTEGQGTVGGRREPGTGGTIIIGPVFPYRAGIAYCTTRLARELGAEVISFKRQFPPLLYPGGDDVDPTLPRFDADFLIDIINPLTWLRAALRLRRAKPDAVIVVWWVWLFALPYLTMLALLPHRTRVILQCHNIGDKEPAAWKRWLTNLVLRRGDVLVVHANSEAEDVERRGIAFRNESLSHDVERGASARRGDVSFNAKADSSDVLKPVSPQLVVTFLPVHELGGEIPTRAEARARLGLQGNVALFFGHVRPFKGLDIAVRAWRLVKTDVTLVVAGEAWFKSADEYRALAAGLTNVRLEFRFIPDAEIATYFAACDVVLAPYRIEAQSGVALTAFHFARPVIATAVGGLPEIIEEGRNGMLIPPEDPAALATAVEGFFARGDREQMERHAAASARKYSWSEYGALMRALVEQR